MKRSQGMKKRKVFNVAIVGGGPGSKAIIDIILDKKLSQLQMNLIGVADPNPDAVSYRYAQEKGIFTTGDYKALYKLKGLNMIIELTGREEVANEISQNKPKNVRMMTTWQPIFSGISFKSKNNVLPSVCGRKRHCRRPGMFCLGWKVFLKSSKPIPYPPL